MVAPFLCGSSLLKKKNSTRLGQLRESKEVSMPRPS